MVHSKSKHFSNRKLSDTGNQNLFIAFKRLLMLQLAIAGHIFLIPWTPVC